VTIRGQTWKVEIADTTALRYQGLSDRSSVPEGTGMLFVYPGEKHLSFCMRNCLAPLDIAFLDAGGRVVAVWTMHMEPRGRESESYPSMEPAQYALEVAGGALGKAGVARGDRAQFSSIGDPNQAQSDDGR
jgi:uncharacterized protein